MINAQMITHGEIIKFAKRKYGKEFVRLLAKDAFYSVSAVTHMVDGGTISRRMELEVRRLMREHQFEMLVRPDVRY